MVHPIRFVYMNLKSMQITVLFQTEIITYHFYYHCNHEKLLLRNSQFRISNSDHTLIIQTY